MAAGLRDSSLHTLGNETLVNDINEETMAKPPSAIEAAHKNPTIKEALIETTARVAHEMNRWYCATLGDDSHQRWADAPAWQRESIRKGVLAIWSNPGLPPGQRPEDAIFGAVVRAVFLVLDNMSITKEAE